MDEKKLIIEDFTEDSPNIVIDSIEPWESRKHYYTVRGKNENGKFETDVFVDINDNLVLELPE